MSDNKPVQFKLPSGKIVSLTAKHENETWYFSSLNEEWHCQVTIKDAIRATEDFPDLTSEETEDLVKILIEEVWNRKVDILLK